MRKERLAGAMGVLRAFLLLVLLALATAGAAASEKATLTLGPKGGASSAHELNVASVAEGAVLVYEWGVRSPGDLDFDVHWHDGVEVQYLVGPARSPGGSGKVAVPAGSSNLSFLWMNPSFAAIEFAFDVRPETETSGSFLPAPPLGAAAAAFAAAAVLGLTRRHSRSRPR